MNTPFNRLHLLGLTAALFIIGAAIPASAQEIQAKPLQHSGTTETSKPQEEPTNISPEKLDAYATSAVKITRIHGVMAPKIQATTDAGEKNDMFKEMQQQMISAVEETEGISVEEYNEISKMAINNPQIASHILGEVKSRLQ